MREPATTPATRPPDGVTFTRPCARVSGVPDEVNLSFMLPGEPATSIAQWRTTPPPFLDGYQRIDESYESLVYEANVTTTFTKFATFGVGKTLYRLAFTFRLTDGAAGPLTRVTVIGQAREDTVAAMGQWAAANAPS
jgi:hypothetical protein